MRLSEGVTGMLVREKGGGIGWDGDGIVAGSAHGKELMRGNTFESLPCGRERIRAPPRISSLLSASWRRSAGQST